MKKKEGKIYSLTIFLGENFNNFPNDTIICTMLNINPKNWMTRKIFTNQKKKVKEIIKL
jgi:hypothetical protein